MHLTPSELVFGTIVLVAAMVLLVYILYIKIKKTDGEQFVSLFCLVGLSTAVSLGTIKIYNEWRKNLMVTNYVALVLGVIIALIGCLWSGYVIRKNWPIKRANSYTLYGPLTTTALGAALILIAFS
jgi:hypothetical protein